MDSTSMLNYSQAFGFLGNSLLNPPTQTDQSGIDPAFYSGFDVFENESVSSSAAECAQYLAAALEGKTANDVAHLLAAEYTKLFVGPPKPSAAPWETMYRMKDNEVGFGQATFDMRARLREIGLQVSNENNQYEDHMGIELLYLCASCSKISEGDSDAPDFASLKSFIAEHPMSWIDELIGRIDACKPEGYYKSLVRLAKATLEAFCAEA